MYQLRCINRVLNDVPKECPNRNGRKILKNRYSLTMARVNEPSRKQYGLLAWFHETEVDVFTVLQELKKKN